MRSKNFKVFSPLLALLLVAPALGAKLDDPTLKILNSVRTSECSQRTRSALTQDTKLNVAAGYLRNGAQTKSALKRANYQASQSASIRLGGRLSDVALRRLLVQNYCGSIADPDLTEVGFDRTAGEIAIVLAAPFTPPPARDASKVSQEVLKLVNDARGRPRKCGRKSFAAAAPLSLNSTLAIAADAHAKDMASMRKMSHSGSDGSSPDQRATRAGYKWKSVGENVAMGQLNAREVVESWLTSPHHCENIMDMDYKEMAVAFAIASKEAEIYWAQLFGRPR